MILNSNDARFRLLCQEVLSLMEAPWDAKQTEAWKTLHRRLKAELAHAPADGPGDDVRNLDLPLAALHPLLREGITSIAQVRLLGLQGLKGVRGLGPTRAELIMKCVERLSP